MEIVRLEYDSLLWKKAIEFAENCSWSAGKHIAGMLKEHKFSKVYIPSDMTDFYEKCGFIPVDSLKNYGGDVDTIFMREI